MTTPMDRGCVPGLSTTNRVILVIMSLALALAASAQAQNYTVLHTFTYADGIWPSGRLIIDANGNIYGTAPGGGSLSSFGTIWKSDPQGVFTVLYTFGPLPDGSNPTGGLIRDSAGNLYGGTAFGGMFQDDLCYGSSCGTIFKMDVAGNMTQLFQFAGPGGFNPSGTLIRDSAGNLYGTTLYGGDYTYDYRGYGTVFKIDVDGNETVLQAFNGANGQIPNGTLTADSAHNLYGTTVWGGAKGLGSIFKIDLNGNLTTLHSFSNGRAGQTPDGGVILDANGNLYGVSPGAGRSSHGAIFKLDPSGHETLLHSFTGGADGWEPRNTLIRDAAGNLYGTAIYGGAYDAGVVFKLAPSGTLTVLHSFSKVGNWNPTPSSPLLMDASGALYGVTSYGGDTTCGYYGWGCGVLYKISPK